MGLSVIKVLDSSFDEGKNYLSLTCEVVTGMPVVGEHVYTGLTDTVFQSCEILEINDFKNDGSLQVIVNIGGPEFDHFWREHLPPTIATGYTTLVCWIDIQQFRQLLISEQHAQLVSFVERYNVGNMTRYVDEMFKPIIKLNLTDGQKVTGLSKFGGLPLAPPGFSFPKDSKNQSGIFICQLDLREVKKFPVGKELKGDGILYVFGTLDETGKEAVLDEVMVSYSGSRNKLENIPLPADLERYGVFPETPVEFFERAELPIADMGNWIEQTLSEEEYEFYSYLNQILDNWHLPEFFALLRPQTHVQPAYYEHALISHLKLRDHKWRDDNGKLVLRWQFLDDLGVEYKDSFKWRHLFEFSFKPSERFTLSNYPDRLSPYTEGHTLMIPQQALDQMDFSKVVLVNMSVGEW